jgi:hypothetical protein
MSETSLTILKYLKQIPKLSYWQGTCKSGIWQRKNSLFLVYTIPGFKQGGGPEQKCPVFETCLL